MWAIPEILPDHLNDGFTFLVLWKLFALVAIFQRAGRYQRTTTPCSLPCTPSFRRDCIFRRPGNNAVDPGAGNHRGVEYGKSGAIILESETLRSSPDRNQFF